MCKPEQKVSMPVFPILRVAFPSSHPGSDMANPELFWMFKSFLELPLEPNCGKVRLVIF